MALGRNTIHAALSGPSRFVASALALALAIMASASNSARADEGGIGMWLPGQFGSLAAAPQVPGWAVGIINYYSALSGAGNVAAAREVTIGKLNPTINLNLNLNLKANVDFVVLSPSYVFATPVFGGQFAASMAAIGAVARK